jgi:hypothetical protein
MMLSEVEDREDLDYRFVRMQEPINQSDQGDLWQVQLLDRDKEFLQVSVESLMRVRPLV